MSMRLRFEVLAQVTSFTSLLLHFCEICCCVLLLLRKVSATCRGESEGGCRSVHLVRWRCGPAGSGRLGSGERSAPIYVYTYHSMGMACTYTALVYSQLDGRPRLTTRLKFTSDRTQPK